MSVNETSLEQAAKMAAVFCTSIPEVKAKTRKYGVRVVTGARIIVEPDENYGKTAGGVYFETRDRPQAGVIRMLGTALTLSLALGDRVTYSKYARFANVVSGGGRPAHPLRERYPHHRARRGGRRCALVFCFGGSSNR